MSQISILPKVKDEASEEVAALLREELLLAEAGDLRAIAIVSVRRDGAVHTKSGGNKGRFQMLGALFALMVDLAGRSE